MFVDRTDKLYIDRLDGRTNNKAYDRFYKQFREKISGIDAQLSQLQDAAASNGVWQPT